MARVRKSSNAHPQSVVAHWSSRTSPISFNEIGEVLDDQWATTLWGCAFEDFLTRAIGVHGSNVVDVYLKRRGWKEGAQAKAYMKALRNSVMSLYEVSGIVP